MGSERGTGGVEAGTLEARTEMWVGSRGLPRAPGDSLLTCTVCSSQGSVCASDLAAHGALMKMGARCTMTADAHVLR